MMNEKELERLAQEELLAEAKRGKIREETMGMLAWKKSPVPRTNKRFLTNMLRSTREPKRKKVEEDSSDNIKKSSRHHEKESCKKLDKADNNKTSYEPTSSKYQHDYHDKRSPRKSKHKTKHKAKR